MYAKSKTLDTFVLRQRLGDDKTDWQALSWTTSFSEVLTWQIRRRRLRYRTLGVQKMLKSELKFCLGKHNVWRAW